MKKVSYVARRVRLLQELVERKVINMVKVSGLANPADMLTKHLAKDIFRKYAANLYLRRRYRRCLIVHHTIPYMETSYSRFDRSCH